MWGSPGSKTSGSGRNCGKLHAPLHDFDFFFIQSTVQAFLWAGSILIAYESFFKNTFYYKNFKQTQK